MMNKKTSIGSWKEADKAIARISKIETAVEKLRESAAERIERIEQRLREGNAQLLLESQAIKRELELFFKKNSQDNRSRKLPSGRLGYRTVNTLSIAKPATTLRKLALRGFGDCIRVRQEIDKQALRRLDTDSLKSVGVRLIRREVFYVKPEKREKA